MAFTSADLDTLDRAIASGTLKVRFSDGREMTYRSTSDLLAARSFIAGQVATADPTLQVGGVMYAEYDRR